MGDFNGANLCDAERDAVLYINISPYKRRPYTNHAHPAFRHRGRFTFRAGFSVTVIVVQLAIPPGCSLLEYRMP